MDASIVCRSCKSIVVRHEENEKGNRCVPANESGATWRNDLFKQWVSPRRAASGWAEVSPFGIFFERHDLHSSFHLKSVGTLHRPRMRFCVQGKKSRAGSIASARTIKKSRRELASRSRPGRCAPSELEVINHDAGLRMGRLLACV